MEMFMFKINVLVKSKYKIDDNKFGSLCSAVSREAIEWNCCDENGST
jgi:hypothetical protein